MKFPLTGKGSNAEAIARLIDAPTLDGDPSAQPPADARHVQIDAVRRGHFVLLRRLGKGGMGSVYAAYDEQLDRKVALKILHRSQAGDEVQRMRTLREARAAARISHPNIIAIYDVGEIDDNIHIAMEYVEGGTLLDWQSRSGRSWREILEMYLPVGEALLAAHNAEVVHRDFKPDNVLIGADERPHVADFGLARVGWTDTGEPLREDATTTLDADAQNLGRLTLPGVIFGTPGYMSPEQYRGGDVDSRSDQWSFCAALYEALYGHLPYSGSTLREHAGNVHGPPSPPPTDTKVPDELRQALCRGLSANPDQRFASMAELLEIFSRELRGGVAADGLSRRRFTRAFIVAVLLGVVLSLGRYNHYGDPPRANGITWAGLIVVVLLGGLWRRQTLLSNRFHRHLWLLVLVNVVLFFLQRIVGSTFDMSPQRLFPFQMLTMAGITTLIAATLLRELFFLPAIPLIAGLLSLIMHAPHRLLILAYPLTAICLAIGWNRAASGPPRSIGEAASNFRGHGPAAPHAVK